MLFGSSGIRRVFDRGLLDLSLKVGSACGSLNKSIVVGTDTRTTGVTLSSGFISGALAAGSSVAFGGIAPTPTVAFAAKNRDSGCCITASHNPEQYNGMKLVNPDGSAYTKEQQDEIGRLVLQSSLCEWTEQGDYVAADIITPHKEAVLQSFSPEREISVVLDCGGGAGSVITPLVLSDAGIKAECINCHTSGMFPRPSEPLETNLSHIPGLVRSGGFDGALIHDGDADRFMAFDNRGRYISGDHLLVLFAEYTGAKRVVTTADASMLIESIAEVRRTPVGDSFVSEELRSWGDFGGEPSGSWIFPSHSLCPDGIYAAMVFCSIASSTDVAERIDSMPDYPILRHSMECPGAKELLISMGAENPTDGIRIEDEDGWCLVRASGTEPKVRITAEGKTRDIAERMKELGLSALRSANGGM
ncbi:MAG: phosphopentomutase/phosphoglucosamine mutase [Methanomicrobiaceae archaeon]|nr:phosphopentomutase/phosphoglucosamine mutase [Methanomicrobiaceae archaeon]